MKRKDCLEPNKETNTAKIEQYLPMFGSEGLNVKSPDDVVSTFGTTTEVRKSMKIV